MTPNDALTLLLHEYRDKARRAIELFLHSARKCPVFDESLMKTPDAMEPYDAMSTRFERALESILHPLLKSVEILETGAVGESLRDRLNFAAKLGLLSDVELWMEMRAARNRIAHDYLPRRVKAVHDLLRTNYRQALEDFQSRFDQYIAKKGLPPCD